MYTAVSRPTRGGKMLTTTRRPSLAPSAMAEKTSTPRSTPYSAARAMMAAGMIAVTAFNGATPSPAVWLPVMPADTEATELIQMAGRMSKGAAAPLAALTAATVVGRSCMEAVFTTTSRHSSRDAALDLPAMRLAARTPMGVAALPRPSRLAETLPVRRRERLRSREARGNRRRRMGDRARESASMAPGAAQDLQHAAPQADQPSGGQNELHGGRSALQSCLAYGCSAGTD